MTRNPNANRGNARHSTSQGSGRTHAQGEGARGASRSSSQGSRGASRSETSRGRKLGENPRGEMKRERER